MGTSAVESLVRGLSEPPKAELGDGSYFERRFAEAARPQLEFNDWEALRQVRHECGEAIRETREGNSSGAGRHFNTAMEWQGSCQSELAKALGATFTHSAIAAWEAARARYDSAEKRLETSYLIDHQLVSECGLKVMLYHQLQSVHNRTRLLRKSGRSEAWALQVCQLLAFIWQPSPSRDLSADWPKCEIGSTLDNLQLDILSRQVLADVAHVMFSRVACAAECIIAVFISVDDFQMREFERNFLQFYKYLLVDGVFDESSAAHLLEKGRPSSARLAAWDAIALETIAQLELTDRRESASLTNLFEYELNKRGGSTSWVRKSLQRRRDEYYVT